jgi:putative spermidine/putrescine transport system permease protein
MTTTERLARAVCWIAIAVAVVYLVAPLVVVIGASLSDSPVFDFPPRALSWRWYRAIPLLSGFWPSIALSLQIAAASTAASLVLGTLAAIAVVQGDFPGRHALASFVVSPLMLPGLVIGVATLQAFRAVGLRDAYASLMIAHVVITLPYVMRTVLASLSLFDFSLIDAARTLGCSYPRALLWVMVPLLAPAFLTGGLFGFLASLDNYPISIFLTDVRNKTLPIQMLQYIEESPDPTIAAVSSVIIGFTVVVLLLGDRLVGLRRAASV